MSHAISDMSFSVKVSKKVIQAECDEWGSANCSAQERGGYYGGLGSNIDFRDSVIFDNYESAAAFLSTTPDYGQVAVKYKVYPKVKPTKTMIDLQRRVDEYIQRLNDLNKPHYANVKSATIKCKHCGSALATAYCGKGYKNRCPVCGAELRPQNILDKIQSYEETLRDLRRKLNAETKKQNAANEKKAVLYWLVHCEVHC